MAETIRAITWEAPEHMHGKKGSDWFWILGIIALSGTVGAIFFDNFLLAILILLGAGVMAMLANREPAMVEYAVTTRGLRVGDRLFPYTTLESFYIDEDNPAGPTLLARSEKLFMHLLVIPLPEEYLGEIEQILEARLPEEHIEEPLAHKILEFFGF